ncbi:MAG: EAL domain-containing protein [Hyphomicrobiales bacterium]|nr:EAL domain-containing protein [Hyphomicrobiales bacterium]
MTLLVLETQSLHLLSHKFVMLSVAASALPRSELTDARAIRQIIRDMSAVWSKLRNSETYLLNGSDPALVKIMGGAFSREAERVFECFEGMAQNVCTQLLRQRTPDPAELGELLRFVSQDLSHTIDTVALAARLVAEIGTKNAERRALTDELTGLPNRRALHELLSKIDDSQWPHDHVAVMHIDLDKFKQINDTLGHAAGDAALQHATKAMAAHIRQEDFIARIGGDEFVLVFFGNLPEETLAKRAEDLIADVSAPFVYMGKECNIGGSVGIACGEQSDGIPLERYMTNADLALYTAKNAGRGTYRFFTPNLRTQHEEIEDLKAQIRKGLESQQFEPYFQPQVEGRSGKIVGFEALARWHHPTRGLLTPYHFLGAAAEGELLEQLDSHLIEQAFANMRRWLDDGLDIPQISVNLSASRLREVDLVDVLLSAADRTDLDPALIGFEILESAMIDANSEQMIENIKNLSRAGFRVELDDFGTGHASISNLRNFKVDRIKIDRSFVKDVHLYSELAKITSAMIGLAHSLRVDALAEGVETAEERLVLNALGCDHIQGFGVARPMSGSDVPAWIDKTQNHKMLPPRRKRKSDT